MATKVTILGEHKPEKELKKIQFIACVTGDKDSKKIGYNGDYNPTSWENIELVSKSNNDAYYDIMFAYNNDRATGSIFMGHFNDGIV